MVIEHLVHHLYIPSKDEPINQWQNKLQACYQLLYEANHAKVVCRENFHTNSRRRN